MAEDLPCCSTPKLGTISKQNVFDLFVKYKDSGWQQVASKYREQYGCDLDTSISDLAVYDRIKTVHAKAVKLRGKKREKYLEEAFNNPKTSADYLSEKLKDSPRKKQLRNKLSRTEKQNKDLKRKLDDSFEKITELDEEFENLTSDYERTLSTLGNLEAEYGQVITRLLESREDSCQKFKTEMTELQTQFDDVQNQLTKVELKLNRAKNIKKDKKFKAVETQKEKVKEKSNELSKTKKSLSDTSKLLDNANQELRDKETEISKLKTEKAKLQRKIHNQNKSMTKSKESFEKLRENIEDEKSELKLRQKELDLKEKELSYLETVLNDEKIQTFEDGKYLDHVRLTVMELLSMNVSVNKVNDVIRTVINRLTNKKIDRLPSKGLRCQLLIEARHLADIQVGKAMLEGLDMSTILGNTLHGDGTTKYHRHFQNFQITTSDGESLTAGLIEIVGQDAQTLLECWQERVQEIGLAISKSDGTNLDLSRNCDLLLGSIKNTMSDQCATNGLFNNLLDDLRAEVLPKVVDSWQDLSDADRKSLSEMGHFFCKVHPLITFAEESNKAILKFENGILEGRSKYALPSSGESGTVRTIRTACLAFQKRGNQQAGVSEDFLAHIDELGVPLKLIQMEGNRFNVIFHNGGAVYYHRDHIKGFIENKHKQNRLLLAVSEDLQNKVYIAGLRALGIVSKLITGPYFRLVGDKESIFYLNPHLHQLQLSLQRFSKDASPLLDKECAFSDHVVDVQKDEIYDSLFQLQDEESQVLTQQILELLCLTILIVLERQCADQLPGGKYASPSEKELLQASSVPTSNIISERDFALFDVLLKQKPGARTSSLEALIMWSNNKPAEWLYSLPEEERASYQKESRKMADKIREKSKQRRTEILQKGKEKLEVEKQKKAAERKKKTEKKIALTLKIEKCGGLWHTKKDISQNLNKLDEKAKIEVLYTQLQYHHIVLLSFAPESYYFQKSRSEKGRKIDFTCDTMEKHLLKIISLNMEKFGEPSLEDNVENPVAVPVYTIAPAEKRQEITAKQKESFEYILKEARSKRKSNRSKLFLDSFLQNPNDFVGKRIVHKVQETEEDIPEWYDATVKGIETLSKEPIGTVYEISYDIDGPDKTFLFPLLRDLKKGNLIVIDKNVGNTLTIKT